MSAPAPGGRPRASFSSRAANLLLLALSVSLPLLAAEVYLRRTSPHIIRASTTGIQGGEASGEYSIFMDTLHGRRLIPNSHFTYVDGPLRTRIDINALGFRGPELPPVKGSGERRILVLGDSIVFSIDMAEAATFVRLAEGKLNARSSGGTIRVVNGGVEGLGLEDEIDILEEQGLGIAPDVVVVAFYLNDGNPPDRLAAGLARPGFLRRRSVLAQTIWWTYKNYQYRRGTLAEAQMYGWTGELLPAGWRTDRGQFMRMVRIARRDWGAAWSPEAWDGIEQQLERLRRLAAENSFKVAVVCFPVAFQVYTQFDENQPQRVLRALCATHGFPFLDLLPILRSQPPKPRLFLDWCHLAGRGHEVVAAALADFLERHLLAGGDAAARARTGP